MEPVSINYYLLAAEILIILKDSTAKSMPLNDSFYELLMERLNIPADVAYEIDKKYNDIEYDMVALISITPVPRDEWKDKSQIEIKTDSAIQVLQGLNLVDYDFQEKRIQLNSELADKFLASMPFVSDESISRELEVQYSPILDRSTQKTVKFWDALGRAMNRSPTVSNTGYCSVCEASPCLCSDPYKSNPNL